ncbi:MAG: PGPGW domain-containing protein [Melioribacteraceae bacterium]
MINSLKQLKKIIIGIIGGTIVLIGLVMIVLPGPAFIVIPLGLSILATEFIWAKKMIDKFKEQFEKLKKKNSKTTP